MKFSNDKIIHIGSSVKGKPKLDNQNTKLIDKIRQLIKSEFTAKIPRMRG